MGKWQGAQDRLKEHIRVTICSEDRWNDPNRQNCVAYELAKFMTEISGASDRFSTFQAEQERQPISFFSRTAAEFQYNLTFLNR